MRNLWIARFFAMLALAAGFSFGQNLTGTWQGVVHSPSTNADARTVVKIGDGDSAEYKATFHSIDQTRQVFPATVTVQNSTVKITIPGIGCVYEAKLSADSNTLAGTIKQGFPTPVPWTLKRVTSPDQAWSIPTAEGPAKPMAADADPAFEVASVKRSDPNQRRRGIGIQGRTFEVFGMSLQQLVIFAYDIHPNQLSGAPAWMDAEQYDITAKPDGEGDPSQDQWRLMMQKLLAERFQLAFHRERRELSVYSLSLAKGGAKITRNANDKAAPWMVFPRGGSLAASTMSMDDFAKVLQRGMVDRPVVNQTALPGRYDFALSWTPVRLETTPSPTALNPEANEMFPDLFTAIQQQLGLKLDSVKQRIDVLVIDKVSRPSDN